MVGAPPSLHKLSVQAPVVPVAPVAPVAPIGAPCGGDDRYWGAENREAAKALTQRTADWYAARKGRLTASSAYKALGLQFRGRLSDVVEGVLFGTSAGGETADMRWGTAHEDEGLAAYNAIADGPDVRPTGLWPLKGQPDPMTGAKGAQRSWFGASPDGVVVAPADAKPLGLVEVKCKSPLAFDRNAPHGGVGPLALTGVHLDERKKTPTGYASPSTLLQEYVYLQVILQLRATELPWCDVVFWTPYWVRVVRVRANNSLAEEVLTHLNRLHTTICSNAKTLRDAHATNMSLFWRLCAPASDGRGGLLPDRLDASTWGKRLRADKAAEGLVDWELWNDRALAYSAMLVASAERVEAADARVNAFIRTRLGAADGADAADTHADAHADAYADAYAHADAMDIGALLDDEAMPSKLLRKIETLTLDRRRPRPAGVRPTGCLTVGWRVESFHRKDPPRLEIALKLRDVGARPRAEGELLRVCLMEAFEALGTPIHADGPTTYWEASPLPDPADPAGRRTSVFVNFWVVQTMAAGHPERGITFRGASALMSHVVGAFAARTDRVADVLSPHSTTTSMLQFRAETLRLCSIVPGETGFLGRVVAKSLQSPHEPAATPTTPTVGMPSISARCHGGN